MNSNRTNVNPKDIIPCVARYYHLGPEILRGPCRDQSVCFARFVAAYLLRELSNLSLAEIGLMFGRHHTTAMNAIERIESQLVHDSRLAIQIQALRHELGSAA